MLQIAYETLCNLLSVSHYSRFRIHQVIIESPRGPQMACIVSLSFSSIFTSYNREYLMLNSRTSIYPAVADKLIASALIISHHVPIARLMWFTRRAIPSLSLNLHIVRPIWGIPQVQSFVALAFQLLPNSSINRVERVWAHQHKLHIHIICVCDENDANDDYDDDRTNKWAYIHFNIWL